MGVSGMKKNRYVPGFYLRGKSAKVDEGDTGHSSLPSTKVNGDYLPATGFGDCTAHFVGDSTAVS
jgi:hypothetical protein